MAESLDMDAVGDEELQARIDRGDFVGEELEDIQSLQNPTDEDEDDFDDKEEAPEDEDEDPEEEEGEEEDLEFDEEDDEEDEEGGSEEEADDDAEPPRIPKSRLDKVIEQREELKERLDWMQAQMDKVMDMQAPAKVAKEEPKAPEYDFDAAEEKMMELVIQDDKPGAAKLRAEIRKAQKAELDYKVEQATQKAIEEATAHTSQSIEQQKFDALVETFETTYPFLDQGSGEANPEAIDMTNALVVGYMNQGKTQSQALRQAVKKVAPLFKPQAKETAVAKKDSVRRKKAVSKNVKASKRQPAKGRASGVSDSETVDVKKMSTKQWKAMSEREKAVLRGDIV